MRLTPPPGTAEETPPYDVAVVKDIEKDGKRKRVRSEPHKRHTPDYYRINMRVRKRQQYPWSQKNNQLASINQARRSAVEHAIWSKLPCPDLIDCQDCCAGERVGGAGGGRSDEEKGSIGRTNAAGGRSAQIGVLGGKA